MNFPHLHKSSFQTLYQVGVGIGGGQLHIFFS